jgi:uncharacterized protein YecE (DUF72 family)
LATEVTRLWVGTDALRGSIERYAQRFDLLELGAEPGRTPRRALLRSYAAHAPRDFAFSVRLPRTAAELAEDEPREEPILHALGAAEALAARFLVVQTPASATPGRRTRERLARLVERLGRDRRVAWEPRGAWQDADAEALASELGLQLVRDLTRTPAPEGDVLYARLGAFGGRLGADALGRAAESISSSREAYVVISGAAASRAARELRELLA